MHVHFLGVPVLCIKTSNRHRLSNTVSIHHDCVVRITQTRGHCSCPTEMHAPTTPLTLKAHALNKHTTIDICSFYYFSFLLMFFFCVLLSSPTFLSFFSFCPALSRFLWLWRLQESVVPLYFSVSCLIINLSQFQQFVLSD